MAITLRATKGSALTHTELDTNFSDLDTRVHTVAKGGTGASTEADARTNLGLEIGTDVLAVPGAWTTPSFDAGNFTASGSMTWTVESGDVDTYAYTKMGKVLVVSFAISTTTVGGTLSTALYIKVPGGFTCTKDMTSTAFISDNGAQSIGAVRCQAAATLIAINKADGTNFSASTNGTTVRGQITLEVN